MKISDVVMGHLQRFVVIPALLILAISSDVLAVEQSGFIKSLYKR